MADSPHSSTRWERKLSGEVLDYLETGGSRTAEGPKLTSRGETSSPWRLRPAAETLDYLESVELEKWLESFEKWNRSKYQSDEEAYEAVREFESLPETPKDIQTFLGAVGDGDRRAGLFASYCINELCRETEMELEIDKPFDYLGAYNDGKSVKINGDAGAHAGSGMRAGKLEVSGTAEDFVGEKMRGGKIAVYGNVKDYAGKEMEGGGIEIRGSAGAYCGNLMGYEAAMTCRNLLSDDAKSGEIVVEGNADDFLGYEMYRGKIKVKGDVKHSAGGRMRGGRIDVTGTALDNCGVFMAGGTLAVDGNTGDYAGSYMTGGKLHVHGHAGRYLGCRMAGLGPGGVIIVDGNVGEDCALAMENGTLVVLGEAADGAAGGTLVIEGKMVQPYAAGGKKT